MNACEWFSCLEEGDQPQVGSESLYLARLYRAGLPVAPGFVVARDVYQLFISQSTLLREIKEQVKGLTLEDGGHFARVATGMRQAIQKAALPRTAQIRLTEYFKELKAHVMRSEGASIMVTLRSTLSDGTEYSLTENVREAEDFLKLLKDLYTIPIQGHILYRRLYEGKPLLPSPYPVLIEHAPNPESSGTFSCYDPQTKDGNTISIQARHLGATSLKEAGKDTYRVDRSSLLILSAESGDQRWGASHAQRLTHPARHGKAGRVIPDEGIVRLSRLANVAADSIDTHQVSWVYSHNQFWLTGIKSQECLPDKGGALEIGEVAPIARGLPLIPGWVHGPVRILKAGQSCPKGEIAVVKHLGKADCHHLSQAAGVIVEDGAAAALDSFKDCLHAPTLNAVHHASSILKNGQVVTLDAMHGVIYAGIHSQPFAPDQSGSAVITATKVCIASRNPFDIDENYLRDSDGAGLLRAECILEWLKMEPRDVHARKQADEYEEIITEVLEKAKTALGYRPLMYQLHDFTGSHSIGADRGIAGSDHHPLLGYRGAKRLMHEPETVALQLSALAKIVQSGHDHVGVVLPMAHTVAELDDEVQAVKKEVSRRLGTLPMWAKVETPGMLIDINKICQQPIEGVIVDVPSLAQLVVGIDKGNARVGHTYSMADSAVLKLLDAAIKVARKAGKDIYLVAEDEPMAPEVIECAVAAGVTGLTVPAGFIEETRHMVAVVEQRVLLDGLRHTEP